jgi:transposase-like protein
MSTLAAVPRTEVVAKGKRRRFSAEYKRKVLKEADGCREVGELGALLRREGLYSSLLADWRRARERGELAALTSKKRGPKARGSDERDRRIAELERQNQKLQARLERAEAIIDVQKKVGQLVGLEMPSDPRSTEKS